MQVNIILNGTKITAEAAPDTLLIDFVRAHGCYSVKRGCETSNCGLCTVFLDDVPVLSCSVLAARADGHRVTTLEGLQEEAAEFGAFIADQGCLLYTSRIPSASSLSTRTRAHLSSVLLTTASWAICSRSFPS